MTIHVTPIPSTIELTTPAFTLGEANTAGAGSAAIASDSALALFSTGAGSAIVSGATGTTGTAAFAQRSDHTHTVPTLANPSAAVVDFQRFISNGIWTKPAGVSVVQIELFGAGGGGGGGQQGSASHESGGGGGGGGSAVRVMVDADDLAGTANIIVGTAGAAGAAGSSSAGYAGGAGTHSQFDDDATPEAIWIAYGGGGGSGGSVNGSGVTLSLIHI